MFGSNGLRCRDSAFAFVGRDGNLIAKLPAAHAPLVAEGKATATLAGRQTTREWVGIPSPGDGRGRMQECRDLIAASHRYVSLLGPSPSRAGS